MSVNQCVRPTAGHVEYVPFKVEQHGARCKNCTGGWWKLTDEAREAIGKPCKLQHCAERGFVVEEYHETYEGEHKVYVCGCGDRETVQERYSFGAYAGLWCDRCWPQSGFRDACDPRAEFHPDDAGERLEEDY